MPLLEALLQPWIVHQKTTRNSWKQKQIDLLSYEQCQNMILENIKIYSQNVHKNNFIIHIILEMHSAFNIIFIQELSWSFIWFISSSSNCKGKELVGIPNHPN